MKAYRSVFIRSIESNEVAARRFRAGETIRSSLQSTTSAALFVALICGLFSALQAQVFEQQGPTLDPNDPGAGHSLALSADGNTAIFGGEGSALVFTRSGGVWTQQGPRLLSLSLNSGCWTSVALSADGNTALVGCSLINGDAGAAYVLTRSEGVWTQQGPPLIGAGCSSMFAEQGVSVALSADGNTALIGARGDNCTYSSTGGAGALFVFIRSDGVWTQQAKLVGVVAGPPGTAPEPLYGEDIGFSVALSADGNTAIGGAPGGFYHTPNGGMFVFTRSGSVWTQQGPELTGSGDNGIQGSSVALSADGNTVAILASANSGLSGLVWVFTRSGGEWTQQGPELVVAGLPGGENESGLALSGSGNTLIVGAAYDTGSTGAAYVFTRSGGVWTQTQKLVGTGWVAAGEGWSVALSADGTTALVGSASLYGGVWVFTSQPTSPPAVDVSGKVHVMQTGFGRNRATGMWSATMTITNTSGTAINGPLEVVLTNLSSNATLENKGGSYSDSPYITVSAGALASGASVTAPLQFTNPSNAFINFTPITYSGGLP